MGSWRRRLLGQGPTTAPSAETRSLRVATWVVLLLGLLTLGLVVAGIRGWLPRATVPSSLAMFGGFLLAAIWLGLKAHRLSILERERESHRAMVIVIAAQLSRQDDETLASIAGRGGPAAEGARMVLAARRNPRKSAATPTSWR